jgi:fructose-1-phosphate kinase PfkB-like protein
LELLFVASLAKLFDGFPYIFPSFSPLIQKTQFLKILDPSVLKLPSRETFIFSGKPQILENEILEEIFNSLENLIHKFILVYQGKNWKLNINNFVSCSVF